MAVIVAGVGTIAARADITDYRMPVNEAAWFSDAGSGVTNIAFDHYLYPVGTYYWQSHGVQFGLTGSIYGSPIEWDIGYFVPAGWNLHFYEPNGPDMRDLRMTFATPQRALSFNNIAWTDMEPIPGSGPRTFIHAEFFLQGIQVGSWVLNQGMLEGDPPPWMVHTFLGFTSDTAFDEVRMGILPQYGGTSHPFGMHMGFHGLSFSTVPAPGALALLGVCCIGSRRRTRAR